MKYIDLINSQFSYGVKKKDILKKEDMIIFLKML